MHLSHSHTVDSRCLERMKEQRDKSKESVLLTGCGFGDVPLRLLEVVRRILRVGGVAWP